MQEFIYTDMSTVTQYHTLVCTDNCINQLLVWLFLRDKNHDGSKSLNVYFIVLGIKYIFNPSTGMLI